jgi:hypothetical protein
MSEEEGQIGCAPGSWWGSYDAGLVILEVDLREPGKPLEGGAGTTLSKCLFDVVLKTFDGIALSLRQEFEYGRFVRDQEAHLVGMAGDEVQTDHCADTAAEDEYRLAGHRRE